MTTKPTTIDEYLAALPDDQRAALQHLREVVAAAVPEAEESISYGMPAFRLGNKTLVGFGAAKAHCAFYPMTGTTVAAFADELAAFDTSKGAIRFQPDQPLPDDLVRRIVATRVA